MENEELNKQVEEEMAAAKALANYLVEKTNEFLKGKEYNKRQVMVGTGIYLGDILTSIFKEFPEDIVREDLEGFLLVTKLDTLEKLYGKK